MLADSFAILADIHGNSWALDAVLADLRRRSVGTIINLGDCFYGPLDPAGTAERLAALNAFTVRGNQDRALLELTIPPPGSTMEFVRSQLMPHLAWLEALPSTMTIERQLFLCHGTPHSDEEYLLEEVTPAGVFLRSPDSLREKVSALDCEVILCAHSHVARTVWAAGRLVLNPGSVGLPAYTDDAPFPHAMEAGSPHARYALLSRGSATDQWQVKHVVLPYEWEQAADAARRNGREDWAQALVSGRAAGA